jgi:biopolymer transport protein ExbB
MNNVDDQKHLFVVLKYDTLFAHNNTINALCRRKEGLMPVWIIVVQWISRSVLVLLIILSVWSVATMLRCSRLLKKAAGPDSEDETVARWIESGDKDAFRAWAEKSVTLQAGTARAIFATASSDPSSIDRAVRSYLNLQRAGLEQGLLVLATLGSNAPFIGLFGTVLGIIQAFGALSAHQTNASDIMVGIAEALIATAIGLFVAIPAVVAYNVFTRQLKDLVVRSEAMKDLYISRIKK